MKQIVFKYHLILWALFAIAALTATSFAIEFTKGSGKIEDPYLIQNNEQLQAIKNEPNMAGSYFLLSEDADFSDCSPFLIIAAMIIGVAFGIHFGRVLNAIIIYWENTKSTVTSSKEALIFLLGGGGGAIAFNHFASAIASNLFLALSGIGLIIGYLWPLKNRYSLGLFKHIVNLSDKLQVTVPDPEQRALIILTPYVNPKMIENNENMTKNELAKKMEDALDQVGSFVLKEDSESEGSKG